MARHLRGAPCPVSWRSFAPHGPASILPDAPCQPAMAGAPLPGPLAYLPGPGLHSRCRWLVHCSPPSSLSLASTPRCLGAPCSRWRWLASRSQPPAPRTGAGRGWCWPAARRAWCSTRHPSLCLLGRTLGQVGRAPAAPLAGAAARFAPLRCAALHAARPSPAAPAFLLFVWRGASRVRLPKWDQSRAPVQVSPLSKCHPCSAGAGGAPRHAAGATPRPGPPHS